jgi:PAS domain S-box-containing protein
MWRLQQSIEQAASPLTEGEETRLTRLVHVIGRAVLAGAFLPMCHYLWIGSWGSGATLVAMELGVLAALGLNGLGRPRAAIFVVVAVLQASAASLMIASRGFNDLAILIFPATLVVGALLLDRLSFICLTGSAVTLVVGIGLAETSGILVNAFSAFTLLRNLVEAALILIVTAVAVGLLADSLRASLARTREREASLAAANAELVEQAGRLRASEARFRSLIEQAVDAILLGDTDGKLIAGNRRAWELTGYALEELAGQQLEGLFLAEELARLPLRYDLVFRGETVTTERLLRRKDGSTVPIEMSSKRMPDRSLQTFLRDISERRRVAEEKSRLEGELLHAQKMEAVGRLAGGVAHDFNNMLMIVSSSVELALRNVDRASLAYRCLTEVSWAAERAAALTRQLLAFGRRQAIEPQVLDLGPLLDNLQPMLAGVTGAAVTLQISAPPGLGQVKVDRASVEQAVLNLAINARDAMPNGGRLSLELGNIELDEDRVRSLGGRAAGPHVVVSVRDTGCGMTEDVRQRIFEPFFTTKPAGQGTGLGLAMVYGTIKQHGGAIQVDSRPGQGTTFRIYLPRAVALGDSETRVPAVLTAAGTACAHQPSGRPPDGLFRLSETLEDS